MSMSDYSMNDMVLFVGACASAVVGLVYALQKSKCEEIQMCCCKCKRNVEAVIKDEKIKAGLPTTPIPKDEVKKLIKKKPNLILEETNKKI